MINSNLHKILLPYPEKGDRTVWVYVPQHNEGETLPVMYMTDGQNLFDEKATPYGSWGVIDSVEDEIKNGSEGVIIVGIDNGNEWRDCELTPRKIGKVSLPEYLKPGFVPEGEIFDSFLINTVKKYVEENFPVKTGRANTYICGSSSGGLQSFFTGIEHKDDFSYIGALSPAFLLYSENDWRNYLSEKIDSDMPYLYIYCGKGDVLEEAIYNSVEAMYDLLPEIGYPFDMMNEVLMFEYKHNEKPWREIFKDFLHLVLHKNTAFPIIYKNGGRKLPPNKL